MDHVTHTENPREWANFWRAAEFDQLELLHAHYLTHRFDRHIHEGYAIGVITQGAESFYYHGDNYTANVGQIVVIQPGEIHTGQATTDSGWHYRMSYPSVTFMRHLAREITGTHWNLPFFPNAVIDDADLAARFAQLHGALEKSVDQLERATLIRATFGALILRHAQDMRGFPLRISAYHDIRQARDYIHEHYADNLSLDMLAQLVGMSPFHFAHRFHREIGLPPHTYLTHVRVEQAKLLLAEGMLIADVAMSVGFVDQSHLTRRFKRIVGVPPGRYAMR